MRTSGGGSSKGGQRLTGTQRSAVARIAHDKGAKAATNAASKAMAQNRTSAQNRKDALVAKADRLAKTRNSIRASERRTGK